MNERKSRFRDLSSIPGGVGLKGLGLRPRGTIVDPERDPVTYVGRLAEGTSQSLQAQIDSLQGERTEGMVLVRLDPTIIGLTEFANRNPIGLSDADPIFKRFKESIRAEGQDTPVGVRPAAPGSTMQFELVEGHRRHAAVLQLHHETEGGFPILARLDAKAADAKYLTLKMYRENAERENLSAHETGSMFVQWLAAGLYQSQREIAAVTGSDESNISLYISVAELPPEILAAFRDPRSISLRWGKELKRAIHDRPKQTFARAAKLAKQDPAPDAETVFKALTSDGALGGTRSRGSKLSEKVSVDDKILFSIVLKEGRLTIYPRQIEDEDLASLYEDLKAYSHKWLESKKRTRQ